MHLKNALYKTAKSGDIDIKKIEKVGIENGVEVFEVSVTMNKIDMKLTLTFFEVLRLLIIHRNTLLNCRWGKKNKPTIAIRGDDTIIIPENKNIKIDLMEGKT